MSDMKRASCCFLARFILTNLAPRKPSWTKRSMIHSSFSLGISNVAHAANLSTRTLVLADTPSCTTQWRKLQTNQSVKPSLNVTIIFENVSSSVLHLWEMELMLPKILNSLWPPPSCVSLVVSYLIRTTSQIQITNKQSPSPSYKMRRPQRRQLSARL